MGHPVRQLLGELRTFVADQGGLGLQGLDVPPGCLRRPLAPGPESAPAPVPSCAPVVAPGRAANRLLAVREALGDCTRCPLAQTRRHIVFGDGDPVAQVVFVGEGPGREEDARGVPFVGEAGRLLGRMLVAMQLTREGVYIANVVKCRPPDNRFPEPEEQASCSPFLWRQLAAIQPRVVVALGRLASQTLLSSRAPMGRLRGTWQPLRPPAASEESFAALQGVPVMPTYHPAYLLRRPEDKKLVWRDLQAVMARLAEPVGA